MIKLTEEKANEIYKNGNMRVDIIYFKSDDDIMHKYHKFVDKNDETKNVIVEHLTNMHNGISTFNFYCDDLTNEDGIKQSLFEQLKREPDGWYYRTGTMSIDECKNVKELIVKGV